MLACRPHRQRSRARNGWRRRRRHRCQGSCLCSASSGHRSQKDCQSEATEDKAKDLLDDKKRMLDEHNSVPDADKRVSVEKNTEIVLAGNRTKTVPTGTKTVSVGKKTENVSEEHKRGAEQAYGVLSWILTVCTNTCGPCRQRRKSARDSGSSG